MAVPRDIFGALGPSCRIAVLRGQEPFLMAEGTRRFLDVLAAEYGSVDRFQFDGRTASLADVLDDRI